MATALSPQAVLLAYWLIILVVAAFSLRMACNLVRTDMPSWRRAFVSVVVVTFLAYLTFDFTCYLIMRSMDGVLLRVPPGYGYSLWFREPIGLKWHIVSHSGPVKYLPFVFALCVAGVLQLIVLQAQVTFRFGLLIFLMQWVATGVAGYILSLLFGVGLTAIGWTPPQQTVPQAPDSPYAKAPVNPYAKPPPSTSREGAKGTRPKTTAKGKKDGKTAAPKGKDKKSTETAEGGKGQGTAGEKAEAPSASLHIIEDKVKGAVEESKDYLANAGGNLKTYADSHLEELKQITAPVTKHLPEPVQNFLDQGGWWWILGGLAVLALLWLRSMVRKLSSARRPARKKKGKRKKRAGAAPAIQREELALIGEGFTETGPNRVVVKGVPAKLRLVVLSMGTKGGGGLSEDMADRVLDWIKDGLAAVASYDSPGVRVWPPYYSADGFATALPSFVPVPVGRGAKSHWVLLAGSVRMGRLIIHVGLLLYTEEASSLKFIKVKGERWLDTLAIEKTPASAAAW
jgi:hypothetical protein